MNPERDDPLLDACLEEVLAGRTPPDLTARIAHAWLAQGGHVAGWEAYASGYAVNGNAPASSAPGLVQQPTSAVPFAIPVATPWAIPLPPPVPPPAAPHLPSAAPRAPSLPIAEPPVARPPAEPPVAIPLAPVVPAPLVTVSRPGPSADAGANWVGWLAGISLAAIVGWIGYVAYRGDHEGETPGPVAKNQPSEKPSQPPIAQIPSRPTVGESQAVPNPFEYKSPFDSLPGANEPAAVRRADPLATGEIVQFVNSALRDGWEDAGVRPSRPASDEEWCARLYVRILGRPASEAEIRDFVNARGDEKRAELVERLVSDPRYSAEFAAHWSGFWAKALLGRSHADADARREFQAYLLPLVEQNLPFDRIVAQLLTASGSNRPGAADYNPATHFLFAAGISAGDRGVPATNRTARVLLGMQLQCAQCHRHPLADWSQDHYWQLASFFRQMEVTRGAGGLTLHDVEFAGDSRAADMVDGLTYFEDPSGRMRAVGPRFLGGPELDPEAPLAKVHRRTELARQLVESPYFGRAVVNRVAAHFLGAGFANPVDDMGPHNPPANSALLERMAEQWAAHKHDLRQLMKWIALSEAFALSSEVDPANEADDPDAGRSPLFAHYYVRPPAATPVRDVLTAMAQAVREGGGVGIDGRRSYQGRVIDGMRDGEFEGIIGKIPPREILQSAVQRRALSPEQQTIVRRIAVSDLSKSDKIEHLFQFALGRSATSAERSAAEVLLAAHRSDDPTAWENLWWALLDSSDFGP